MQGKMHLQRDQHSLAACRIVMLCYSTWWYQSSLRIGVALGS